MSKKRGNGEGSIYQMSDGRWRAAVSNGFQDGKPSRKIYTAATRGEVKDKLTKALNSQQQGLPLVGEKQTVQEFMAAWLKGVAKPSVRPKTLRTYEDIVRLHVDPIIGKRPLAKLTPAHVRDLLCQKSAAGLSPRTVKHILVTIRGAFEVAVKDGMLPRNVASLVDPPRAQRPEPVSFNPEQARAFLKALQGDRLEALFTVTVALGLRQGEILGLSWNDIDFESGVLNVRNALQRVEKKLIKVEPKSASSRRPITLPAIAISVLCAHRARQQEEKEWSGEDWQDTGFVFTTSRGTPMDPRNVIRRFKAVLTTAELPEMRFHDLRHSAATLLLAQGVSPRYVSDLLGHSQVSFTMQTYAHVLPQIRKDVASKMDEIFSPVATTVATKAAERKPS